MQIVVPNESYHILGTDLRVKQGVAYHAVPATNQPDYEAKGKVFIESRVDGVIDDAPCHGVLLEKGEYTNG
jgi:hypothetical protein